MSRSPSPRLARPAVGLLALLVLAADAPPSPSQKIQVTVLTVLASERHSEVNDRIREIAAEIQKKEPKLTGFRLERSFVQSVPLGKCVSVKLVDKQSAEVCVNEKPDATGRAVLTIKPPDMGEIVYSCRCGKCFPIVTNYYTEDGRRERLIIVVMAKPCQKKP